MLWVISHVELTLLQVGLHSPCGFQCEHVSAQYVAYMLCKVLIVHFTDSNLLLLFDVTSAPRTPS
jgi:hypothetical protein